MKTTQRFLSKLLMAMVMMAMSSTKLWADVTTVTLDATALNNALAAINERFAYNNQEEYYSLTFAYTHQDLDVVENNGDEIVLNQEGTIKLYMANDSYYVVAPTTVGAEIKAPKDCTCLFYNLTYLNMVTFDNFNTSEMENACQMFQGCTNLSEITFGDSFDTSNVTNMASMFQGCKNLMSLDLSGFNTSKVTNMSQMFSGCNELSGITFGDNFDTSNVTVMPSMFGDCQSLLSLDLSNFNTSNVESMGNMFYKCEQLQTIIVGDGWTTNKAGAAFYMFYFCSNLKGQNGTAFDSNQYDGSRAHVDGDYGQPGYLTHVNGKVKIASSLASEGSVSFDITPYADAIYTFTTSNTDATIVFGVKNGTMAASSTPGTFKSALAKGNTYTVRIENNTSSAMTDLTVSISKQAIVTLDKSALQTALSYINSSCDKNNPPFLIFNKYSSDFEESELYTTVKDDEGEEFILGTNGEIKIKLYVASIEHHVAPTAEATILAPADCSELFKDLTNIFGIIFYNFDTSNVTNMSGMFKGCSGVGATLDLSNFDTSNVTNMGGMFSGCSNLPNLDLSSFDTSNVTDMSYMFEGCTGFDSITFGENFNTSNVTNMSFMFNGCENLQEITFSVNFNTSNVKDMSSMFKGCRSLESENFDLSSFDTSNVTDMSSMFEGISTEYFSSLDLSSFDTSKVTNMNKMFDGCWGIHNLTIDNFDMSSVDVENNGALYMFACETLYTLTMKSLPYLVDGTFNSQFSGTKEVDWEEVPVVVNVELDDNSVVYTGQDNHLPAVTSATYTRQMGNEWGTLVMPYNIGYSKNNDYKLYYLTDATVNGDEGTLTLTEYNEGTIAANTPMVVKATGTKNDDNKYYIQIAGETDEEGLIELTTNVAAIDHNGQVTEGATTALPTGWKMNGTFESTNIQCGAADVYFIAQGQFWKADVETSVAPFRAWFEVSTENSAPANLRIVTDDETEGIELIDSDNGTLYMVNGQCHDLMGRKTVSQKGLQILDGRVIMVK